MSLRIIHTSPLHSLQDLGRFGGQSLGVTTAGPLDVHAFSWAHYILGNSCKEAALELIRGGFIAEFMAPVSFALTGADCAATLAGKPCPNWITHAAEPGDRLVLQSPRQGQIAYLAVAGGWEVAPRFGSVSTSHRDQLGGLHGDGSPLVSGDSCFFRAPRQASGGVPRRFIPNYQHPLTLRFMPGYQWATFSPRAQTHLLTTAYTVGHEISRMGYRLQGTPLPEVPEAGLSEPIAFGSIQVPPDGQPIVLLRDRQSLGGYPKLGVVVREDIGALCQRRPGDPIIWETVERADRTDRFVQQIDFFGAIV